MNTTQNQNSSNRRREARRSSAPPPGASPPPNDGPNAERSRAKRAGAAGRLSDATSLRVEDARRLRDELRALLQRYDDAPAGRAYTDGMTAGCAATVNPGAALRGLLDSIECALRQSADGRGGTT